MKTSGTLQLTPAPLVPLSALLASSVYGAPAIPVLRSPGGFKRRLRRRRGRGEPHAPHEAEAEPACAGDVRSTSANSDVSHVMEEYSDSWSWTEELDPGDIDGAVGRALEEVALELLGGAVDRALRP